MPQPRPPAASRPRVVHLAGRSLEVEIRRHRAARRYTLRLADDGRLRLTVPRWASVSEGLRFVSGQGDWIQRERLRQAVRQAPWRDGTAIWYRGARVSLTVSGRSIVVGEATIALDEERTDVRDAVEAYLRSEAAGDLPVRCRAFAERCGLTIASVRVRNQRSRWGACSARGAITLNWRLIQMPSSVADYIILHELMHLRQPNHSRRFWREVAQVCPWWREAEGWLRRWGKELM